MANNTRGPRGRSRKPRPGPSASSSGTATPPRPARRQEKVPAYRDFDDRPQAPWHPLPLSELLILAGIVAFVIALIRLGDNHGIGSAGPLLLAGILALGLGTAEVSWREHRSGFRSHTLLLAFIPVLALHTLVVVGYSTVATAPRSLNVGMFFVDAAVFFVLVRYLRARFRDARARR